MTWQFDADRPIYKQLKERILLRIVSGEYGAGAQLPPVRELAEEAAVNPNTLQKALAELERDGLVYALRTSGRFVTEDRALVRKAKDDLAAGVIDQYFGQMQAIGYTAEEAVRLLQNTKERKPS